MAHLIIVAADAVDSIIVTVVEARYTSQRHISLGCEYTYNEKIAYTTKNFELASALQDLTCPKLLLKVQVFVFTFKKK